METYIRRLERIGISAPRAYQIVWDFLKNFGHDALNEYISDLEREAYVDRI